MKKIVNGKMYNTETAKEITYWNNGLFNSDFGFCEETLYQKSTGEYFLCGHGGPYSKYSRHVGNTISGSHAITPLTEDEARSWMEKHCDVDEYIAKFGEVEE